MAANLGTMVMAVQAKTDHAEKGLGKIKKGLGSLVKVAGGVAAGVGIVATALTGIAVKAAASTDRIDKLSQRLGLSRDGFQEWEYVLSQAGVSIDAMQMGMKTLSQKMADAAEGTGRGADLFKELKVNVRDTNDVLKTQEQVFNESIAALQGMEAGIKKADLAQELFGRNGQDLLPLLNGTAEGVEELKRQAHELGMVLGGEAIDAGVVFTDSVDTIKRTLGGLVTNLGASVIPMLQSLLDWIITSLPQMRENFNITFTAIMEIITPLWTFIKDNILPIFEEFRKMIKSNMPEIREKVVKAFKIIIDIATTLWTFIKDNILPILTDLYNWIKTNMPQIKETASAAFDGIIVISTRLWNFYKQYLLPILKGLFDIIKWVMPGVKKLVEVTFKTIITIVTNAWYIFDKFLLPILEWLFTKVNEWFPVIQKVIVGVFNFIIDVAIKLVTGIQKVIDVVKKAIDWLSKFISKKAKAGGSGSKNSGFSVDVSGYRAEGGPVVAGNSYIVGEKGIPEIFTAGQSGMITPLNKAQVSGANIIINVYEARNARETAREVVRILGQQGVR